GDQLGVPAALGEAVGTGDLGDRPPGLGDAGVLALDHDLLLLTVVDHRAGQLRQAPLVLQDRHGQVLDLGIVVAGVGHHRRHRPGPAQQPQRDVDVVDGVVQRAATTLGSPGPPPPQVIVGVAAPPLGGDPGVGDPAYFARVQH